ncbi:MAG TPA: metal-sensitive transcriptional regulator [Gemmatimonadaceae bacterium]|jgi:CsoR family transcriptional regulator, copper-sensing transcriptional repressor|nr:metal-sensitive transcriptional regulator [Gemmatimonadaceae bacterium]
MKRTDAVADCACEVRADETGARKAVAVDPDIKARNLKRLRRIEGQVRGLQKMVEDDRYCADVMTQIASVHEALRSVGRELMRNHLRHCASKAIRSDETSAEAMYDELIEMMYRNAR